MLLAAAIFSLCIHVFLLIFFAVISVGPYVLYNAFSVCFSVFVCKVFVSKRKYKIAGYLLTLDIAVYTILQIVVFAENTFTELYFILLLLMQMIIPFSSRRSAVVRTGAIWAACVISFTASFFVKPLYSLGEAAGILALINLNVAFIAIVIELSLDSLINRLVDSFTAEEYVILEKEANLDPLTGLYNRRYAKGFFLDLKEKNTGKTLCVAMADIDDFKNTNDTYGHTVGDKVLKAIAQAMKKSLRKTDTLFRWGGEEFLLVLENLELREARKILEKVRLAVAGTKVAAGDSVVQKTITIGAAVLSLDDIEGSIEESDKKLYEGKQNGKNQVVV